MEVKNTFPLKNDNGIIKGYKETLKLIYNFIRKSKKFYEISNKKNIRKIHILFLYDSFLQTSNDMEQFTKLLCEIFNSLKITIDIRTTFDIVYFANPASFNSRKLSDIVIKLKNENEGAKTLIEELKKKNDDTTQKMEDMKKENNKIYQIVEELRKKNQELEKNNQEKIEKLEKQNKMMIEDINTSIININFLLLIIYQSKIIE